MSYSLADLKNSAKVIRGVRNVEETRKAMKNELGPGVIRAIEIAEDLQAYLDANSKYPSLMGAQAWTNLKKIEDSISQIVAVQVEDDYIDPTNGRRRRLPKITPLAVWNIHAGRFDVLLRAVQINGENFALARGAWEEGYQGDVVYDEEMAALEESRNMYNQSLNGGQVSEDELPQLETLSSEEDHDQPSTSRMTKIATTSKKTTTMETSKEARVRQVDTRRSRIPKRQRKSSDFDMDDDAFINLLGEDVLPDKAEESKEHKASRKIKRKK
jgi:hypothetical protein